MFEIEVEDGWLFMYGCLRMLCRRSSKVGVLRQNRPARVSPSACLIGWRWSALGYPRL